MPFPALCFQEVISFVKNVRRWDIKSRRNMCGERLTEFSTIHSIRLLERTSAANDHARSSSGVLASQPIRAAARHHTPVLV